MVKFANTCILQKTCVRVSYKMIHSKSLLNNRIFVQFDTNIRSKNKF